VAERADRFIGRTWVLDQVLDWLEHGGERFLLLTGEPGAGKTALAAWLAGAGPAPGDAGKAQRLETVRRAWRAAHFCVARGQRGTVEPSRFVNSLAQQLADRIPAFAQIAVEHISPEYKIDQQIGTNWGQVIGVQTQKLASIMAPATPFFFCTTQKHLTGKIVWNSRA
jgi:energy-coupling factor transporter ATP-binding protein EcfA2